MNLERANGTPYFDLSLKPNFHYIFSSWFLLNFQWKQSLKIRYCLHCRSENYKITSMQPYSLRAFQECKERDLVPLSFWIQQLLQCRFKHYKNQLHAPLLIKGFPRIPRETSLTQFLRFWELQYNFQLQDFDWEQCQLLTCHFWETIKCWTLVTSTVCWAYHVYNSSIKDCYSGSKKITVSLLNVHSPLLSTSWQGWWSIGMDFLRLD